MSCGDAANFLKNESDSKSESDDGVEDDDAGDFGDSGVSSGSSYTFDASRTYTISSYDIENNWYTNPKYAAERSEYET